MDITDSEVIAAMQKYGGHFASALGAAAMRADMDNLRRIKVAFPEMWESYRNMAKGLRTTNQSTES